MNQRTGHQGYSDEQIKKLEPKFVKSDQPELNWKDKNAFADQFGKDWCGASKTNYFAMKANGFLKITKPGLYSFQTNSDDGSRLTLGDKVVVNNWGIHPNRIRGSTTIKLEAGFHPIKVDFFENNGGARLIVNYLGPDTKGIFKPIKEVYN